MSALPRLHGGPLGRAAFKTEPEDFVVEERLGFEPSGEGEHCLVWVEKRDVDSNEVASRLARALGIRRRLVSHCGLKDRGAVARQWFSLHLPGAPSPGAAELNSEGVRALGVARHHRKLRRGFHRGNRFTIRLRDPEFGCAEAGARWAEIAGRGVPNYFGPQRFGRDGDNVDRALRLFRGESVARDRWLRGLLISAARSHLFNQTVAERLRRGCWETELDGEVYGFADNRSLVLPGRRRGDEAGRFLAGDLELTAALWGDGEPLSTGAVRELEAAVAERFAELARGLVACGLGQERRVLRARPARPKLSWERAALVVAFDLPKGTYATAVLRELATLREPRRSKTDVGL